MGGTGRTREKDPNIIRLTAREHFIAHKLLAEENPDNYKIVCAFSMMAFPQGKTKRDGMITPEEYQEARELFSKGISGSNNPMHKSKGKKIWCYGLTKYTDSRLYVISQKLKVRERKELTAEQREHIRQGQLRRKIEKPDSYSHKGNGAKGKICITNGIVSHYINPGEEIPEGFRLGQAHHKKYVIKDISHNHNLRSKLTSGENNPMFGKGYKVAGGNNGKATKYYIFNGLRFECRKELVEHLKLIDSKISKSTIRKFEDGSKRVRREHPILDNLIWDYKENESKVS